MAGCVICKKWCPTKMALGSLLPRTRPTAVAFPLPGSLPKPWLRSSFLQTSIAGRSRGFLVVRSDRGGRIISCVASSAASEPWNNIPKASDSVANAIPLPGRPGQPPKRRYIAGVDQTDRVDPWLLADKDSRFAEFYGVQLHYKIAHPPSDFADDGASSRKSVDALGEKEGATSVPAVLLHGFGASLFSWDRVLKPLAALIGSGVVAFDRPAFGLTSRPQRTVGGGEVGSATPGLNPFGLEFSVAATLSFVEFLHAQQVILIGHSAGCLVALQAYLDAPEKVAALILVAPALAAPIIIEEIQKAADTRDPVKEPDSRKSDREGTKKSGLGEVVVAIRAAVWWALVQVLKVLRLIKAAVQALFETLVPEKIVASVESSIQRAREKLISAIIRSPPAIWTARVVMDRFGTRAVRMSWYDPKKVDKYVIDGYTKPLRCKDWERALLEYVLALAVNPATGMQPKSPLGKRLKEVTCPVLVVTGDTDRLVPAWNARRLASALPNAEFALIKQCGHLPHEETPEEFLCLVEKFVAKICPKDSVSSHTHVPI